ncbi:MAG TPA: hypothetical protein DCP91_13640, partial [Eggerthellaceae bacterium]|nr:hypothetical protein [Eggerthellaceae bacterium]
IQAVAGVAVALSAVAGVALRRGRKTLFRVLDIDENARRTFEADVHRTDSANRAEGASSQPEGAVAFESAIPAPSASGDSPALSPVPIPAAASSDTTVALLSVSTTAASGEQVASIPASAEGGGSPVPVPVSVPAPAAESMAAARSMVAPASSEPEQIFVSAEAESPAAPVSAPVLSPTMLVSDSPVPAPDPAGASALAPASAPAAEPASGPADAPSLAGAATTAHAADAPAATAAPSEPASPAAGEHSGKPPAKKRRKLFGGKPYKPTWKERLIYGAIVAAFFTLTIYFIAPLEIVAGAAADLIYSVGDVWWVLVLPDLGIIAGITAILALLRGRGFGVALLVVCAVGLCAYLQALLLNVGLPAADGNTIVWADFMGIGVVSTVVWVVVILAAIVFALLRPRRAQGVAAVLSVFLVLVQAVGLGILLVAPSDGAGAGAGQSGGKVVMTEDQLFTVNPNHNVIVFILDTYDTAYLSRVLDMNPNLLQDLTGFTNYENATSAMIPTRFAIPEMLTGQMPSFDEPFSVYTRNRYSRGTYLQQIYDANYSIGLYTDSLRISSLPANEQLAVTGKTVNMHDLPNSMMDFGGTLYSLYQMGQYRDVLWPLKWAFWYYTDQINQTMVSANEDTAPDETVYVMDDIRYYNRLRDFGLSLEPGGYDGAFRFIHLLGSHYPFNYDEEVNDLGQDNSNVFKQSQGVIRIVSEYVNQLKELGVYENTTIIITADHGYWTITLEPIEETSTPIMFVKPEQSAEEDAQPIKVDEKPVSHLDLQATVLDAMGLDYSEYTQREQWAGYSMFGPIDPDRKRYYLTTDSEPDLTEVQFREYLIDGNALDWNNWSETGRTIDAQK